RQSLSLQRTSVNIQIRAFGCFVSGKDSLMAQSCNISRLHALTLLILLVCLQSCRNVAEPKREVAEVRKEISIDETGGLLHQPTAPEMLADGITPLMYVASWGEIGKISDFLARGADINVRDKDGWTALHHATLGPAHPNAMRMLVKAGADVNAQASNRDTALILSARKGASEAVEELVLLGTNVNLAGGMGQTALIAAAWHGRSEEDAEAMVEVLLQAGADTSPKDGLGMTALAYAKERRYRGVIQMLKDAGAAK
ncbi:MAG: ankyrin repeat domain-containing protein, partial [Pyrinomonadaceae bacterium]